MEAVTTAAVANDRRRGGALEAQLYYRNGSSNVLLASGVPGFALSVASRPRAERVTDCSECSCKVATANPASWCNVRIAGTSLCGALMIHACECVHQMAFGTTAAGPRRLSLSPSPPLTPGATPQRCARGLCERADCFCAAETEYLERKKAASHARFAAVLQVATSSPISGASPTRSGLIPKENQRGAHCKWGSLQMTAALKSGTRQEVRRSEVVASSSKTPKGEKKHGGQVQHSGRVIHSGASHGARTKAEVESKRVNSIEPTQKCLCQNEVACVCPVEAVCGAKQAWEAGFHKNVRTGGGAERTRKTNEETEHQKRDDGNKKEGGPEAGRRQNFRPPVEKTATADRWGTKMFCDIVIPSIHSSTFRISQAKQAKLKSNKEHKSEPMLVTAHAEKRAQEAETRKKQAQVDAAKDARAATATERRVAEKTQRAAEAEEKRGTEVQANREAAEAAAKMEEAAAQQQKVEEHVANKKAQEAEALMNAALKTDLEMKTEVGQVDIGKTATVLNWSNARREGELEEVLVEALMAAKEQVGHHAAMRQQSSKEDSKATTACPAPIKKLRARSSCFRCGSGSCVNFDCIADVPFDCMEDAEVGAGYQLKSKEEITAEITAEKTRKKQAQVEAAKDARAAMAEERRVAEASEAAEAAVEKTRIRMPFECMEDVGEPPFGVKKAEPTDFGFEKTSSEVQLAVPDTADTLERNQKVKAAVQTVETLTKSSVQRAAGEEEVVAGNTGSKFTAGPSSHAERWPSLSQRPSGTHRLRCARDDCPCAAGVLFRTGIGCTHRL